MNIIENILKKINKKSFLIIIFNFLLINKILCIEQIDVFIFIHGTYGLRNIKKNLKSIKFLYYLYKDVIENEFLSRMLDDRWSMPLEKMNYLMGTIAGFQKIEDNSENVISKKALLTLNYLKEGLIKDHSKKYDFYLFNWDGVIYEKNRCEAGKNLYNDILKLKEEYLKKGLNPNFYLIGYSHGGTVASYLFKYAKENDFNDLNEIECLILLGVPIREKINNYVFGLNKDDFYFFKKVLNIYSNGDYLQLAGSFFDSIYSKRFFKEKRDNLFQFEFQYNLEVNLENIYNSFKDFSFFHKFKNSFLKLFKPPVLHRPDHAQLIYYSVPKKEIMIPVIVFIPYLLNIVESINKKYCDFKSIFSINTNPNKLFIIDKNNNQICKEIDLENFYNKYAEEAKKI